MDNPKESIEYLLGQMNQHLASLDDNFSSLSERFDSQDGRIVNLENINSQQKGSMNILGYIVSAVIAAVTAFVASWIQMNK